MSEFYVRDVGHVDVDEDHGTATLFLFPYGKPTPIVEFQPRGRVTYREEMLPGSIDRAIRAGAGRIPFVYGHSEDFGNRLGVAIKFWEQTSGDDAGAYAQVRFDRSKIDSVHDAVTTSHSGISVGFRSIVPAMFSEREGSLVSRRSIALGHIAAVPNPAYADARVLAVRNVADELDVETDAEREAAEQAAEYERLLREAHEAIEARARWDAYRR